MVPLRTMNTTPTCTSLLRAPAAMESLRFFRSAIAAILERHGADAEQSFGIMLALSEAVTNAIEHGSLPGADVEVSIHWSCESATFCVTDRGSGAESLQLFGAPAPPPDSSLRGRGLVIIHRLADTVSASAVGGGTRLNMVFHHPSTV